MVDGNLDASPLNKGLKNLVHLLGPRKLILNSCLILIYAKLSDFSETSANLDHMTRPH